MIIYRDRLKNIDKRLDSLEKSILLISGNKKIKCVTCYRERYAVEFHKNMRKENVKSPICAVCCSRKNRDKYYQNQTEKSKDQNKISKVLKKIK